MTIQFSHSPTAKLYVLTIHVYRMALNATLYLVVFHCLVFLYSQLLMLVIQVT